MPNKTIYVRKKDEKAWASAQAFARANNISMSELIRLALIQWLEKRG